MLACPKFYFDMIGFSDAAILYVRIDVSQFSAVIGVNAPRDGQALPTTLCLLHVARVWMVHCGLSAAVLY